MKATWYLENGLVLYLLAQGIGGIFWWCLLLLMPESRSFFLSDTISERVWFSFWLPDFLIFIVGSLVAAYGLGQNESGLRR